MKPPIEQVENLLAAKRGEGPGEGYWRDFLCEFHQRQREHAVRKSPLAAFFGRLSEWAGDAGPSKWVYGAGVAYATLTVAFFLTPRSVETESMAPARVNHTIIPATVPAVDPAIEQLDQLDLSPSTQGSAGEQVF